MATKDLMGLGLDGRNSIDGLLDMGSRLELCSGVRGLVLIMSHRGKANYSFNVGMGLLRVPSTLRRNMPYNDCFFLVMLT